VQDLVMRHLCTIPFENLSLAIGQPVSVDPDRILHKATIAGISDSFRIFHILYVMNRLQL
jgi:hypothetical protein